MLNFLIKYAINKHVPKQQLSAEEYLYDKEVYQYYLQVRADFHNNMKNKQLTRVDILHIKEMLNKALKQNLKDYRSFKFKNDAHEIYIKLQNKYLSKKSLQKIDKYIIQCAKINQQRTNIVVAQVSQP